MKKLAAVAAAAMLAVTPCTSMALGDDSPIVSNESTLAYAINNNFETARAGAGLTEGIPAGCITTVLKEDDNQFVRITNTSEGETVDARFDFKLDQPISGKVVVRFDARVENTVFKQIPMLLGTDASGMEREAVYIGFSDNGSFTAASTAAASSPRLGEWQNYTLAVNTEDATFTALIDNETIQSGTLMGPVTSLTAVRFFIRGEENTIDVDNLQAFHGELAGKQTDTSEEQEQPEEEVDYTKPLPMPMRYPKETARAKLYHPAGTITIDGKLDEADWSGPVYNVTKQVNGTVRADAAFAAMWDEGGIYVGCWAFDDILAADKPDTPWMQDDFEIYFDGGLEKNSTYDANDRQYSLGLDCEKFYNQDNAPANMAQGVQFAQARTDSGWTIEMYVPFTAFGVAEAAAGTVLGFDVGYNDSYSGRGERDGQVMWNGTGANSSDASNFGEIELIDAVQGSEMSEKDKVLYESIALMIDKPHAFVNGFRHKIDRDDTTVTPIILDETTFVPIRFLGENLGAEVGWDETTGTATLTRGGLSVSATIDNPVLTVNGEQRDIPQAPRIIGSRTYLPLRAFSEAMGEAVQWDERGVILIGADSVPVETITEIVKGF